MLTVLSSACITSMVRIKYMVAFSKTYDTTCTFIGSSSYCASDERDLMSNLLCVGDNVDVIRWSLIELLSTIVCGSIPPCRPLITRFISSLASTAATSSLPVTIQNPPGSTDHTGSHVELMQLQHSVDKVTKAQLR